MEHALTFLILAIITLLFGIAFFVWGIYQIKTGKMVAKRAKNTVDEPKQVGIFFIFISFINFWLTYIFFSKYFSANLIPAICIIITSIEIIFFISIIVYGLINKRIFGFKNTSKVAKYVRKYYIAVNLAIFTSLIFAIIIALNLSDDILTIILSIIIMLLILAATFFMVKIEHDSRK